VQHLEVGDLRLVAGLGERLEAVLDELRHAAAEHGLLTEQVGLGLLGERRLDDAGARPPIAFAYDSASPSARRPRARRR
jgi:hypothetical protein